jgi:phospholipid/cholesterol/gamma-HCH transport system substrate-binding protein
MLVMTVREQDPREHRKLFLAGIGYLLVTALLIGLSTAIYTKFFDDVTTVTLKADKAGMQLSKHGDVRYNGVLVGYIREIRQSGESAVITLALEPESAQALPRDVDASILPTTLFGRKYVSLDAPADKGPVGIPDGMVIPEERVTTSVELGRIFSRLHPLLRTVRPVDLNKTLSALATALNGRGDQVGDTLVELDDYLTDFNVHLPTLQEDLRLLASVSKTYEASAPDLLTILANLTVTSRTIVEKRDELPPFLASVTDVADLSARILEDNEVNAVRAVQLSEPVLRVLAKYSPEYECLLRGIAVYKPILEKTFEGGRVKQYVEFPSPQHRGYDRRDLPAYKDKRGPRCYGLPNNPPIPWPGVDLRNGTNMDTEKGRGNSYAPPGGGPPSGPGGGSSLDLAGALSGRLADSSTEQSQRRTAEALLSMRSGRPGGDVPALSTLMYRPLVEQEARGWSS